MIVEFHSGKSGFHLHNKLALSAAAALTGLAIVAFPLKSSAATLYDNSQSIGNLIFPFGVVSNPGAGSGGFDLSAVTPPDAVLGFNPNPVNSS
jgi:hypothetical protein